MNGLRVPKLAEGYNQPCCFAMFLAQIAHARYLKGVITYEQYAEFSNLVYRIFPTKRSRR